MKGRSQNRLITAGVDPLIVLQCALAIAALCCLRPAVIAQSGRKPQGQQPAEKPIAKIETREVAVPLVAYDARGNYVDDLEPKDVIVLEDGESRPVSNIKRESANIVLILDLSNEIGTFKNAPTERYGKPDTPIWEKGPNYKVIRRPTQWEFARQFISGLSPNDKIAIIQYAEKAQLIQDWTSDRNQALNAINSKYRVGIKSSFLDALNLAAEKLQTREQGRRVVVLVSDGLDSNSKTGRSKVMAGLEKSKATVFVLGWAEALKREVEIAANWAYTHEQHSSTTMERVIELRRHLPKLDAAAVELRQLAESSGGEMWLPATHDDLIASWKTLVNEIGAQYSLSFLTERKPSLEDDRRIEVLPARPGLAVRSRRSLRISDDLKE
ncbi:MAG: VWA domain-containing protein [Blastocatellia bacterium]